MSGDSSATPSDRCARPESLWADRRGVQWTLEAFLAVLLLLSALVVVASVLPVGTQQAGAELAQTQLQQAGDDVLRLAEAEGSLRGAVLYWNTTEGEFVDTQSTLGPEPHYVSFDEEAGHPLAGLLVDTLDEQQVSYNIHVEYETAVGVTERHPLVYQGAPGGDSVTTSATVLLYDDDRPHESPGNCTLAALDNSSTCGGESFYAPDTAPDSDRYNVVQVRVELWRA